MAMITFEDLPSTNTPINAANLNNNFSETEPVNSYNTSTSKSYSCDYANQFFPETVWTGELKGGENTTLDTTKVKRFLRVYFTRRNPGTSQSQSIIYDIDTTLEKQSYGAGQGIAFDENSGADYYVSESYYNNASHGTPGYFKHNRTGYFRLSNGSWTSRNATNNYYVYRIDTFD